MLRVGLTGGLGSGKSTAAQMFAAKGAYVFSADEIGRELMQPGQAVYAEIVERFGPGVVKADGQLDRGALAGAAFGEGRIGELEAIVHPAAIARQAELMEGVAARDADAVAMVESALIFETKFGGEGGWHRRFDTVVLVAAPEEIRIARFVGRMAGGRTLGAAERAALEAEARRRMANQVETERNEAQCEYVLRNDGALEELQVQVDEVWPRLMDAAKGRV
jgi:dephospho-CoA kinase